MNKILRLCLWVLMSAWLESDFLCAAMFVDPKHGNLSHTDLPVWGKYRRSGGQWVVSLENGFYGAAIGPRLVCTSRHVRAKSVVRFRGEIFSVWGQSSEKTNRNDSGCFNFILLDRDLPDWAPVWRGEALSPSARVFICSGGAGRGAGVTNGTGTLLGYRPRFEESRFRWYVNQLATATTLNEVNPTNCPTWTTRFERATGDDAQAVGGDSGGPAFVDTAEGWKYLGALESAIPAKPGVDYFGIGSSSVGITLLRDLGLVDRYRGTRRKIPH